MKFDSVLLGDNPFFGIDHLSQERARKKASVSQNFDNAIEVIKCSFDLGVRGMVLSTHPTLGSLIDRIKSNPSIFEKFEFYPILPYAQGYVSKINEKGMINTLIDALSPAGFRNKMKIITKGGIGLLKKDLFDLFRVFIDMELLQLNGTQINTVFLHNTLTDLALSLNMRTLFETFLEHLQDDHKVKAGLVTNNFPMLVNRLDDWGLEFPSIMTSFNKVGFQMNPSREACENSLKKFNGNVIAMNMLAGGYIKLDEAYEYISSLQKIRNVVVGVSTVEHAKRTFELFR